MKDAFYFSHDSNARHDPKLVTLINEYGLLGYSYFFILIELLREQDQYRLPLRLLGALTKEWQTPNNVITKEIIDRMIELRLIDNIVDNNEEYVTSDSLCQRMSYLDSIRQKRSDAGKKGMAMRYHRYNTVITQPNKESKVKESKVKESKVKESKVKESKVKESMDTIPPMIENVINRCEEMEIIADLNIVLGANYKPTAGKSKELIQARLKEGFTVEDFKTVHRKMAAAWGLDNKMRPYLRPITLYSNKFESYLNRPGDITQLTTQQQSNLKQLAQLNKELNNDHPGI